MLDVLETFLVRRLPLLDVTDRGCAPRGRGNLYLSWRKQEGDAPCASTPSSRRLERDLQVDCSTAPEATPVVCLRADSGRRKAPLAACKTLASLHACSKSHPSITAFVPTDTNRSDHSVRTQSRVTPAHVFQARATKNALLKLRLSGTNITTMASYATVPGEAEAEKPLLNRDLRVNLKTVIGGAAVASFVLGVLAATAVPLPLPRPT